MTATRAPGAPLCTWTGHDEAGRTCAACGAAICDHCSAAEPHQDRCAPCVRASGTLPWVEHRAWLATVATIVRWSRSSLDGVPREGSLGPSIAFAAIATTIHVVGTSVVNGLVTWWMLAASLERFGARDSVGRILLASDAWNSVTGDFVASPVGVITLPYALVIAARPFGRSIPLRAAAHAVAYLSAWSLLTWIPGLGWLGVLGGITAIHAWLDRETALASPRAAGATALAIALTLLVQIAALEITAPLREWLYLTVAEPLI